MIAPCYDVAKGGVHGLNTSMARNGHRKRADVLEWLPISMPFFNNGGHRIYTNWQRWCASAERFGASTTRPGAPRRRPGGHNMQIDVVFSAAEKQGRLAPLTQIVPHCGESEGGDS